VAGQKGETKAEPRINRKSNWSKEKQAFLIEIYESENNGIRGVGPRILKRWRERYKNDNYDGKKLMCQAKKLIQRGWVKPTEVKIRRKEKRHKAPVTQDIIFENNDNIRVKYYTNWLNKYADGNLNTKRRTYPKDKAIIKAVEGIIKTEGRDLKGIMEQIAKLVNGANYLADKWDQRHKAMKRKDSCRKNIRKLWTKLALVRKVGTKNCDEKTIKAIKNLFKIEKNQMTKKWREGKIKELKTLISLYKRKKKNLEKFLKNQTFKDKSKKPNIQEDEIEEIVKNSYDFWNGIWGNTGRSEKDRIKEVLKKTTGSLEMIKPGKRVWKDFLEEEIKDALKKKKNFSSPGVDGITNFWLKELKNKITPAINIDLNRWGEEKEDLDWLSEGRTVLIVKDTEGNMKEPANYRPITCLKTIYKWITSILLKRTDKECERRGILDPNQRGGKKGSWGTVINNRIDYEIIKANRDEKLVMMWVDFTKAFDSIFHKYLKYIITDAIGKSVRRLWKNLVRSWNTKLEINGEKSDKIYFKRGIYQGDSLSPKLFILCVNTLSLALSKEGWGVKCGDRTITHLFYMDDLKLYENKHSRIESQYRLVKKIGEIIGLKPNPKKCGITGTSRNIVYKDPIPKVTKIYNYKYLGIREEKDILIKETIVAVANKYEYELKKIWSSKASSYSKVKETNQKANALVKYIMFNIDIPWDLIITWATKQRVTIRAAGEMKNTTSNAAIHGPRETGYMGIEDLETMYIKAKAAVYLHLINNTTEKDKCCIFKKIEREATEALSRVNIKLTRQNIEYNNRKESTIWNKEDAKIKCKNLIKEACAERWLEERKSQKWAGKLDKETSKYNEYLFWSKNEKLSQPFINDIIEHREDNKAHKANLYRSKLSKDKFCRHCGYENENQQHISVGCGKHLNFYNRRHNKVVKRLAAELIKEYSEEWENININSENVSVRGKYRAGRTEIILEPVYSVEGEFKKPDMIWINHANKYVYILEVGITWDNNLEDKSREKRIKYECLKPILIKNHNGYKVFEKPIIIGALGTINKELVETVEEILPGARPGNHNKILERIQLDVIKETLGITKVFLN